jgi:hypothetical protein
VLCGALCCTLCENSLLFYDLSDGEDDDVDDINNSVGINNSIDIDKHQDASYTLERQGMLLVTLHILVLLLQVCKLLIYTVHTCMLVSHIAVLLVLLV